MFDESGPPAASGSEAGADAVVVRFTSCRWHATQDNGGSPYCSHRDVLPYTGVNGFSPDAWCPECDHFKARRSVKKRPDYLLDDY